ncbi:MAG: pitrilysin family protein [Planctomycetota bacterium]
MPDISTHTLSCGLPILIEHIQGVRSAACTFVLPAGVALDPKTSVGLSAIWSEMLMRGAGERDSRAQADAFDRLGCRRAIANGRRRLSISASMVGARLPDVLPLIVDTVRAPHLSAESLEPARQLALQAIESLPDDPTERTVIAARHRHLPFPFNRTTLGEAEHLRAIKHADVVDEWRARAVPTGSVLSVAGDVDEPTLLRDLDKLLNGWEGSFGDPDLAAGAPRGVCHIADDTQQVQIVVMHDAPEPTSDDAVLEKLVLAVLSGGMASRLFTQVREQRGLCYSVHAGYASIGPLGSVEAYVGTTPERAQQALDVLCEELVRINTAEGAITAEEFERARTGLKSRIVFSGESTAARAAQLAADYDIFGRGRPLEELTAKFDAVTLDQVNEYASRRSIGRPTIQTLGPVELAAPEGWS